MKSLFWTLAAFGSFFALHASALTGGISSNGGDAIPPWIGSAWFGDMNRVVKACYVVASDFGANEERIREDIQSSFRIWDEYVRSRPEVGHADALPNISMHVQFVPCDGQEDLKFYFGLEDERVRKGRQKFFEPLAFSFRESYENFTWGKGLIWVAGSAEARNLLEADWSMDGLLKGLLIHELGHVMGNEHFEETIMRENIVAFLKKAATKSSFLRNAMTSSVDWGDHLWTPMATSYVYEGVFAPEMSPRRDELLRVFLGRSPAGEIKAKFFRRILADHATDETHLVLSDDKGERDFKLESKGTGLLAWLNRPGTMFRRYDGVKSESRGGTTGILGLATVKGLDGKVHKLVTQRGGAECISKAGIRSPAAVRYLTDDGVAVDLFVAYPGGVPFDLN